MDILSFFDRNEYTKCLSCGRFVKKSEISEGDGKIGICKACSARLPIVPVGMTFEERNSCIDYCMSTFFYRTPIRELIIDFKFRSCTSYGKILAKYMHAYLSVLPNDEHIDCIVPVPLSQKRFIERGYNQSEILSRYVAEYRNILHLPEALERIKTTKRQSSLSPWKRGNNIDKAFVADKEKVWGKAVLLIDDIYTTGSTVRECAKSLSDAGAKSIKVFTLARQPAIRMSQEYNNLLNNY